MVLHTDILNLLYSFKSSDTFNVCYNRLFNDRYEFKWSLEDGFLTSAYDKFFKSAKYSADRVVLLCLTLSKASRITSTLLHYCIAMMLVIT